MKPRQLTIGSNSSEFKNYWKRTGRVVHGGEYAKGKRKTARPFSPNKAIHIVMRSTKAKGSLSFRQPRRYGQIVELLEEYAATSDIRLYNLAVNGNHIHFLIRAKTRKALQKFLRASAGHLARLVTGACRGNAQGKFWDDLVFTRILEWGLAFKRVNEYIVQNVLEAAEMIAYKPRISTARSARGGP